MSQLENGQSVEIFRNVNPAKLAQVTGGASLVTSDQVVALWRDGGVSITVTGGNTDWTLREDASPVIIKEGITNWAWRGVFQTAGHIIPDSAVLFGPDEIKVVLPGEERGPVQGFTIKQGRIRGFESNPVLSNDPLRQAAVYARDVFVARQEASTPR